jgi:hypothetical protein
MVIGVGAICWAVALLLAPTGGFFQGAGEPPTGKRNGNSPGGLGCCPAPATVALGSVGEGITRTRLTDTQLPERPQEGHCCRQDFRWSPAPALVLGLVREGVTRTRLTDIQLPERPQEGHCCRQDLRWSPAPALVLGLVRKGVMPAGLTD